MRKQTVVLLICALLLVAAAPWIAASCSSQPLLPRQLKEERERYDAGVATAQQATMDWQRAATSSPPKIIAIGTLEPAVATLSPTATTGILTPTFTVTPTIPLPSATEVSTGTTVLSTSVEVDTASAVTKSSVTIVSRTVVTQTATPVSNVVIVQSAPIPEAPATPTPLSAGVETTPTLALAAPPANPRGMVQVEDVITEQMLADQVQQAIVDDSLSGLVIDITRDGLRGAGQTTIVGAIQRPVEMYGTFAIANESLEVRIDSILLNGRDVTERYRPQLEDSIRWELYKLLPQRYVQSFVLTDGQILVQSLKRP